MSSLKPLCLMLAAIGVAPAAFAAPVVQKVKPPVAEVYIDLATYSGGMPSMQGGGVTGMLGSLFGGGNSATAKGNNFGNTQAGMAGRWMDVTLLTRKNPGLTHGEQATPAGSKFTSALKLQAPEPVKIEAAAPEHVPVPGGVEMPKGKMYLYWGCSAEVRKGQPLVLDMGKMDRGQMAKFFQNRGNTSPVPNAAPGRPVWPNKGDDRMLPAGASMAGEHSFSGQGVPDDFRVNIGTGHDLMPPLDVTRSDEASTVLFKWKAMDQARAWFIASMGARVDPDKADKGDMEMVFWTSSELPDMGTGLLNYQPNGSVDKWLKEKVLLPASTTECVAPKEAVGPMSMTRMIAYGEELNLAHPPRPKDPKVTWEPEWSAKVRLKSMATIFPGMGAMAAAAHGADGQADKSGKTQAEAAGSEVKKSVIEGVATELFKGLFNRK